MKLNYKSTNCILLVFSVLVVHVNILCMPLGLEEKMVEQHSTVLHCTVMHRSAVWMVLL